MSKYALFKFVLFLTLAGTSANLGNAQVFTSLYNFGSGNFGTNADGSNPLYGLAADGGVLFGTTPFSGTIGGGTLFRVNIDGSCFTNLHNFSGYTNDGYMPESELTLSGNIIYGSATGGGSYFDGTIFKINKDGSGFSNIYNFSSISGPDFGPYTNYDGSGPRCKLLIIGNVLYGTTEDGGTTGNGVVFKMNVDGSGFTNLHNFNNTDGSDPRTGLVNSGSYLYGTTHSGGRWYDGTVFSMDTNGNNFATIHDFGDYPDGVNPRGELLLSGTNLFGTTYYGGTANYGTVYKAALDGSEFTNLHNFSEGDFDPFGRYTNADGMFPYSGLILNGNILYGTVLQGGSYANGTAFSMDVNGSNFITIHNFQGGEDGLNPLGRLVQSGTLLYGTTRYDGVFGNGTVFSISIQPQLNLSVIGSNAIVTWPAFAPGYNLQSSASPIEAAQWSNSLSYPSPINGSNTITNLLDGKPTFYRLVHQSQ